MTEGPRFDDLDVYATPADLPATPFREGWLEVVLSPPSLYIYTQAGGHQLVASSTPTTPASEGGQGVVRLATQSEVENGTAGVIVATVARLKAELDRRDGLPPAAATETARGALELATSAEAVAGTLTGAYAMNPARVRESIQPEAWIAATLQNGWANFGATHEGAGYRKTPTGEVQLRGLIKNGTTTNGTTILNLASAYRSAKERVCLRGRLQRCVSHKSSSKRRCLHIRRN